MPDMSEYSDLEFYGKFRTDLPKEEGFSRELISSDIYKYKDSTNVDELNVWPYPEIDTFTKAIVR
jgi:hypothetical protein